MTTFARLVRPGDEWGGKLVTKVEHYTRALPHFPERTVLIFEDGSKSDEWSEARLVVNRPMEAT